MTIWLTKTWGFDVPAGPLLFSLKGWRERARSNLRPGDLVAIAATKGRRTAKHQRGQILGLYEPTAERVMSIDFALDQRPEHLDVDGQYKWPYGLHIARAWSIDNPPELLDLVPRNLGPAAALGIMQLTEEEASQILSLPRTEIEILSPTASAARRMLSPSATRRHSPTPRQPGESVFVVRDRPASTYLMRVVGGDRPGFKIGWAFSPAKRCGEFNHASLPELGGLSFKVEMTMEWDTARMAYKMEQALLRRFEECRLASNHEIIVGASLEELELAWTDYVQVGPR